MQFIERTISKEIKKFLFKGKIIVLYGPRQVGKTTLVKNLIKDYENTLFLNCDEPDIRQLLENKNSTELKLLLKNKDFIVIDEAQRVKNIGITLKLIIDNFPKKQILVTGSSSLELSNKITESLTGRKLEFLLLPFSIEELSNFFDFLELKRLIPQFLIFGMYPEVVLDDFLRKELIKEIAFSYSLKDIFAFNKIRNHDVLENLLKALSLQIGNLISFNELSTLLNIDKNTVSNYVNLLEKFFILKKLNSFNSNLRNEIKKRKKILFFDLGIRNSYISNFNPINMRIDIGQLWENFVIIEFFKLLNNHRIDWNLFFWRYQRKEIDIVIPTNKKILAFEVKWNKKNVRAPKKFFEIYKNVEFKNINKDNFLEIYFSLIEKMPEVL